MGGLLYTALLTMVVLTIAILYTALCIALYKGLVRLVRIVRGAI